MTTDKVDITNTELYASLVQIVKEQSQLIVDQINESIIKLQTELSEAKSEIVKLKTENHLLRERVYKLEINSRSNNLVIFGIPHIENENKESLANLVITKFNDVLNVNCSRNDLSDIYRLGKSNDKIPVIIKFVSHFVKDLIIKNAFKFKDTGVSISRDLPPEERNNFKILRQHLREAKSYNLSAKIHKNTLIVDDKSYTINELPDLRVKLLSVCKTNTTRTASDTGESAENDGDREHRTITLRNRHVSR